MGGAEPSFANIQKRFRFVKTGLQEPLEPLECPEAGSGYRFDITQRDALPEQADFLLVLVLVAFIALTVG